MPETVKPRKISQRERALIDALQLIVRETIAFPPARPVSADSYLPPTYVANAQTALALYGEEIKPLQVAA